MSDPATALAFINEAIQALSIEAYRGRNLDERVDPIQATLAIDLERIDTALGPRGESMFAPIAESIKEAMIALHGAKGALDG